MPPKTSNPATQGDRTLPQVELAMAVVTSLRTNASKIRFCGRITEEFERAAGRAKASNFTKHLARALPRK